MVTCETCVVNIDNFDPSDKLFVQAFHDVDTDKNGYLNKSEFRQFMIEAKQEKVSKYIFHVIDKDKTGKYHLTSSWNSVAFCGASFQKANCAHT